MLIQIQCQFQETLFVFFHSHIFPGILSTLLLSVLFFHITLAIKSIIKKMSLKLCLDSSVWRRYMRRGGAVFHLSSWLRWMPNDLANQAGHWPDTQPAVPLLHSDRCGENNGAKANKCPGNINAVAKIQSSGWASGWGTRNRSCCGTRAGSSTLPPLNKVEQCRATEL